MGEKEAVNEIIRAELKKQVDNNTALARIIEALKYEIDEDEEQILELMTEMQMAVSILNQELNINQALEKQLDALQDELTRRGELIGKLNLEVDRLREELGDEVKKGSLQWLQLKLIELKYGITTDVKKVYTGTKQSCDSQKFYDQIKGLHPNLFLATERATGLTFGGFTEQTWETTSPFKGDPMAFTFSASNRAVCKIKDENLAINTDREREGKKLMLTFGNYDITLVDNCLLDSAHTIKVNQNYECPQVGYPNFYTRDEHPTLSSFEFYTVDIHAP